VIVASRHDTLAPAALLESAPALSQLGAMCLTEVRGHTSYPDPAVRAMITRFLESTTDPHEIPCT
jgi:hypothetical protein